MMIESRIIPTMLRMRSRERLVRLSHSALRVESPSAPENIAELDWFHDPFGAAGGMDSFSRQRMQTVRLLTRVGALCLPCISFGTLGLGQAAAVTLIGWYGLLLIWMFYVRACRRDFERRVVFYLPLTLEALVLLVGSGLGMLPAIERLVSSEQTLRDPYSEVNPVTQILGVVYRLTTKGVPLKQALEEVSEHISFRPLRHTLLHLDVSGTEGGELIPSLRALSDYSQSEWRSNVETRVKRLENFVVFPVFAAVIGLILLTAAVPLVPVLEFRERLHSPNPTQSIEPLVRENFSRGNL